MLRRLFVHVSNYTLGSLLVTLAGLISFPLFTRIFSVSEYGMMSLVSLTLMLVVGVGKLGFQHAIVRFYAEMRAGKNGITNNQYFSTVVVGMAGQATFATLVWMVLAELLPTSIWRDPRVMPLIHLTAVLVLIRIFDSAFLNILRAEQRSALLSLYGVIRKYIGLVIVIGTIYYIVPGIRGFYVGTIVSELFGVVLVGYFLLRHQPIEIRHFSWPLMRAMLIFGIPMVGHELGGVVLNVGDRYVLQALIGSEAVGLYSASYNMCEIIQTVLAASFGQAVTPMYTKVWEEQGKEETVQLVSKILHLYVMLGAIIVAGLAAVGPDVLALLASKKYAAGAIVIPWVIAGKIFDGALPIAAAGIFIDKQTRKIMILMLVCAALNIGLNFLLIPSMGILGSAVATLISHMILTVTAMIIGSKSLPVSIPYSSLLKFSVLSYLTYLGLSWVTAPSSLILELSMKVGAGALIYGVLVFIFDQPLRDMGKIAWGKLNARL